jgi:hypothetical protein
MQLANLHLSETIRTSIIQAFWNSAGKNEKFCGIFEVNSAAKTRNSAAKIRNSAAKIRNSA